MRKLRIAIGIVVLAVSLAVLAWGILPGARARLTLRVSPIQMRVPTPSSFVPGIFGQA